MSRLVYRSGSASAANMTPRLEIDLRERPGQTPGLSTFDTLERAWGRGRVAQEIDLDLLRPPLRAFPDRPEEGGTPSHVSIAPADAEGGLDRAALFEWASTRGEEARHPFTQIVMDCVLQTKKRRPG